MPQNEQISATELVHVETQYDGHEYTADLDPRTQLLDIYRDGVWAGSGRWDGSIVDCAAELAPGNGSEIVYDALDQELSDALVEVAS